MVLLKQQQYKQMAQNIHYLTRLLRAVLLPSFVISPRLFCETLLSVSSCIPKSLSRKHHLSWNSAVNDSCEIRTTLFKVRGDVKWKTVEPLQTQSTRGTWSLPALSEHGTSPLVVEVTRNFLALLSPRLLRKTGRWTILRI